MKRKTHYREPWSFVELCCDGMYKKERLKGKLKKLYQRKTRTKVKINTNIEIKNLEASL
jgi:hypothetical protein